MTGIADLLFASAEVGIWFDINNEATLFQDADGTTPVSSPGDPVGRVLDLSGNGLHATQASTPSKPTWQARYNVLERTDDFADSGWSKSTAAWTHNHEDSQGGFTASRWETPTDGPFNRSFVATAPSLTYSLDVKYGGTGDSSQFRILLRNSTTATNFNIGTFDTQTGNWTIQNGWESRSLGNGWYRLFFTQSAGITVGDSMLVYYGVAGAIPTVQSAFVARPQVVVNATDPRKYQRVSTATSYDMDGFRKYLQFDGIDDFLVTPSMNLTHTNKVTLASHFNTEDLTTTALAFLANHNSTGFHHFVLMARNVNSRITFQVGLESAFLAPLKLGLVAPLQSTWSCQYDGAIATADLRQNGVTESVQNGPLQTGSFFNVPLYIGAQTPGTTRFFKGRLFNLVVRDSLTPTNLLEQIEHKLTYTSSHIVARYILAQNRIHQ